MDEHMASIATHGLTAAASIAVAAVTGYFAMRVKTADLRVSQAEVKAENKQLKMEMLVERYALGGFGGLGMAFSEVNGIFKALCDSTAVDRILVLCAWNGERSPQWTTAVWQYRTGEQKPVNYLHVELDADYIQRLRDIQDRGPQTYQTADMPPECLIRGIYEDEGVTSSMWMFLTKQSHPNGGVLLTYMSFASHTGPLSVSDQLQARLAANRIEPLTVI